MRINLTMAAFLVGVVGIVACSAVSSQTPSAQEPWSSAFAAFDRQDQASEPPSDGILFVGSSSIRMWDVQKNFPDISIINRGFGGSQMSDVLRNFDRLILRYRPKVVVLYEGDNDIAAGESAAHVAQEFRQLDERLKSALPNTVLVYLSIKPSRARWQLYPDMQRANELIQAHCQQREQCQFVDVSQVMLGSDGEPMTQLFLEDGLHLNESGYQRWSDLIRPLLDRHR